MKSKKYIFLFLVILVIMIVPQHVSDVYIRLHFSEIAGDNLQLFYATDTMNSFGPEQCITSIVDKEKMQVTFRLDGELHKHITGLRIDYPLEEVLKVESVTVSSAGVVKKQYDPIDFYAPENIAATNDMEVILIKPARVTALSTGVQDPFLVLGEAITEDINHSFSKFWVTKMILCCMILVGFVVSQKRIFKVENMV